MSTNTRIWDYLLYREIIITAEYLPGVMNIKTVWELRNLKDLSEWKLKASVFKTIFHARGPPDIELFAS